MIFDFADSRDWLRKELEERILENSSYSAHAFARKLGLSQSYCSRLLSSKRPMTIKAAKLIGQALKLSEKEMRYFALLVKKENAKNEMIKKLLECEIAEFKKVNHVEKLDLESLKFISDWHHPALLELITVHGIPHKAAYLAERLGIDQKRVESGLSTLVKLGLIKFENDKYIRSDSGYISTPTDIVDMGMRSFHKQMSQKAVAAIEEQGIHDRHFSGVTMAINPKYIPTAKKRIEEFRKELSDILEVGEKDRVYQFTVQFFRLDKEVEI